MKHFSKALVLKALLISVAAVALALIAGCTSGFAEPFDINNIYFNYVTVSDSDGEYIIITKHIASRSDVKIPDVIYDIPVREIADSVFTDDDMIKSVSFGKNMRRIGDNAFGGCKNLQSVTFNVSMSDIGEFAFQECSALRSVELPSMIESLGRGAFYGCSELNEITMPESIKQVGGRAFSGTAWLSARSKEDMVIIGDGILIAYNGDKVDIKLPNSVRCISGAFAGNTTVQSVALRKGIITVGDMAFMGCSSMKDVNIPSTVTEIGNSAFYGCKSIKKLSIPESVQYIGEDAFTDCRAALYVRKGSYAEKYCAEHGIDCFTMK